MSACLESPNPKMVLYFAVSKRISMNSDEQRSDSLAANETAVIKLAMLVGSRVAEAAA